MSGLVSNYYQQNQTKKQELALKTALRVVKKVVQLGIYFPRIRSKITFIQLSFFLHVLYFFAIIPKIDGPMYLYHKTQKFVVPKKLEPFPTILLFSCLSYATLVSTMSGERASKLWTFYSQEWQGFFHRIKVFFTYTLSFLVLCLIKRIWRYVPAFRHLGVM